MTAGKTMRSRAASLLKGLSRRFRRRPPADSVWLDPIRALVRRDLPHLLETAPRLPAGRRKRILFWAMAPWSYAAIDGILSAALRLRGHETVAIACDGLEFCEADQQGGSRCDRKCLSRITPYLDAFQLPWRRISSFVSEKDAREARQLKSAAGIDDLRNLVVDGVAVGDLACVNTGYYQGLPATLWDFLDKDVYRSACATGYLLTKASDRLIDELKPDIVVTTGGRSVIWAPVFERARTRGLGAVNWEDWNVDPHGFRFDHRQAAIRGFLEDVWPSEKEKPLTEEERAVLQQYFRSWKKSETTPFRYYANPVEAPEAILRELGLGANRPVVALFPNILREDNTVQGKAAFPNQISWLRAVAEYARRRPETQMVLRIHPAESTLPPSYIMNPLTDVLKRFVPVLPDNFKVIPSSSQISSYALAGLSAALMVWTGTLGIELAAAGRRVLVAGEPGYRGKGFTVDIRDAADMENQIALALGHSEIGPRERAYAERYAYLSRFRTLVRFPFHGGHREKSFRLPSLDVLAPGGDPVIGDLCDCILTGRPFIDVGFRPAKETVNG